MSVHLDRRSKILEHDAMKGCESRNVGCLQEGVLNIQSIMACSCLLIRQRFATYSAFGESFWLNVSTNDVPYMSTSADLKYIPKSRGLPSGGAFNRLPPTTDSTQCRATEPPVCCCMGMGVATWLPTHFCMQPLLKSPSSTPSVGQITQHEDTRTNASNRVTPVTFVSLEVA